MYDIYLSPPHLSGKEKAYLNEAIDSGWIAPTGNHQRLFEEAFAEKVESPYAVSTNSGTGALHLALLALGIGKGDNVLVSNFTFVASVNPILYVGATPIFIGSESESWNLDPEILTTVLKKKKAINQLPKALILVHLYGQSANLFEIKRLCKEYGIFLIEDAAEALGTTHEGKQVGTFGDIGFFSFNGNKIITTSGGGMLVTSNKNLAIKARKLATQARENVLHYEHREIGYNYRLSNILCALGLAQLEDLSRRIALRKRNFYYYKKHLSSHPDIALMPISPFGVPNYWLSCITIDQGGFETAQQLQQKLAQNRIEARPLWKPMHLQPLFDGVETYQRGVEESLFKTGLCLPSGSNLTIKELERIVERILE